MVVTDDRQAALDHAAACLARAGGAVVVEEYLDGPEVSLFAITDGSSAVPLVPAQDFKRVGEGDSGPNTGGMGAYAPLPWAPDGLVDEIMARVVRPTIDLMARAGHPLQRAALRRPGPDLARAARGGVQRPLRRPGDPGRPRPAAHPAGRPAERVGSRDARRGRRAPVAPGLGRHRRAGRTGVPRGPDDRRHPHRGARRRRRRVRVGRRVGRALRDRAQDGDLVATGGRVLCATARAADLDGARERAYELLEGITLEGGHYRRDIALAAAEGRIPRP